MAAQIQIFREEFVSELQGQVHAAEIPGPCEPRGIARLRELWEMLARETKTTEKALRDWEYELEMLRQAIAEELAHERREAWRREARNRILAGENPDALHMNADMTFADYFSDVREILAQIERDRRDGRIPNPNIRDESFERERKAP